MALGEWGDREVGRCEAGEGDLLRFILTGVKPLLHFFVCGKKLGCRLRFESQSRSIIKVILATNRKNFEKLSVMPEHVDSFSVGIIRFESSTSKLF